MLHQKQILEWLKMFSVNQIKHFLTIKNPKYLSYIERILNYRPDCKPKERWSHGYSESSINNQATSIYQRDKFRYKKEKDKKKGVDDYFSENITVSRMNPYSLSVKKEFIKNGKLSECMLILSDEQIFNCITVNYYDSAWFNITSINSFSQWIVRFFELEIFEAYYAHESVHTINHFVFAEQCLTPEKVKQLLQNCIKRNIEKSTHHSKMTKLENTEEKDSKQILQISKEEGPYLLQKCLERLDEEGRDLGQIIFEDVWYITDSTSKVNRVYKELYEETMQKYSEYLIDVKCQEIDSYTNSKKKKKKAKKSKQQSSQTVEIKQAIKTQKQPQQNNQAKTRHQWSKLNELQVIPNIQKPKKDDKIKVIQTQKQSKNKQSIKNEDITESSRINEKKANDQKEKQQHRKTRRILNERINENIQIYYEQLYESSQSFDKYRKICYQIIKNTMEELKIVGQWRLELFGSASINFALKQSDLDLVLIIENEKSCSLVDIFEVFKVKQWLIQCHLIEQTRVPIVEFGVLLSLLKNPKYKENKKLLNSIIHVDISISYKKLPHQEHQGLKNTQFLKQILEDHPNLRVICLILKDLLRVNELNKPYKGGIGSYVLVILVHNILKMKDINFEDNLIYQLKTVAKYMTTQFEPFMTLITPFKNSKLKADSDLSLNIEDPHENVLLHTSARLINEIIALFKQLYYTLEIIQSEMAATSIQERKKMKKIFFQNWNMLFVKEEAGEVEKNV